MLWFSQKRKENFATNLDLFPILTSRGVLYKPPIYYIFATKVGITRIANAFDVLEFNLYMYAWMCRIHCKWPKCFMRSRGLKK